MVSGPIGPYRDDLRAAMIAHVIANASRDKRKRKRPFKIEDFLFAFSKPFKQKQSWQEQLEKVKAWNQLLGGQDLTKGDSA